MRAIWRNSALAALVAPALVGAGPSPTSEQFSCDAPAGRTSSFQRPLGTGPITVSAKVHVNDMRPNREWLPVINVALVSDRAETANRVGIRLMPDAGSSDMQLQVLFPNASGSLPLPAAVVPADETLPITIRVTDREFRVDYGRVSRTANTSPGARWRLAMSCSAVDAHFDDILITAN